MMCRIHSSGRIFALFQFLSMILISLAGGNDLYLTTNELRDKYGQGNEIFNVILSSDKINEAIFS